MRSRTSDAKLMNLFLDMLAAEQGAGPNTLDAYRRDLTDFSGFLAGSGKGFAAVDTQMLRNYLADLDAACGLPRHGEADNSIDADGGDKQPHASGEPK